LKIGKREDNAEVAESAENAEEEGKLRGGRQSSWKGSKVEGSRVESSKSGKRKARNFTTEARSAQRFGGE